jgi:uncharacterized membrane protein required for colicin V production
MGFKFRNSNALLVIGLWLLALANIWHWFASHVAHFSEGITDLTFGFFMGAAIGVLLLSIMRRRLGSCSPRHS